MYIIGLHICIASYELSVENTRYLEMRSQLIVFIKSYMLNLLLWNFNENYVSSYIESSSTVNTRFFVDILNPVLVSHCKINHLFHVKVFTQPSMVAQ